MSIGKRLVLVAALSAALGTSAYAGIIRIRLETGNPGEKANPAEFTVKCTYQTATGLVTNPDPPPMVTNPHSVTVPYYAPNPWVDVEVYNTKTMQKQSLSVLNTVSGTTSFTLNFTGA